MRHVMFFAVLITAFGLSACDRQPASNAVIGVPGAAGPQSATDALATENTGTTWEHWNDGVYRPGAEGIQSQRGKIDSGTGFDQN